MNSQRGSGSQGNVSNKGKAIENPDSITHDMLGPGIENQQDDGWELFVSRKNRNRSGPASARPPPPIRHPSHYGSATPQPRWGGNGSGRGHNSSGGGSVDLNPKSSVNLAPNLGPYPNSWPVTPDPQNPGSQVNPRLQLQPPQHHVPPHSNPGVHPPLVGGWNWAARASVAVPQRNVEVVVCPPDSEPKTKDASGNNDDMPDDSDDDLDGGYSSGASQKRHETRKQNKYFKAFFDELDRLKVNEINAKQWHCPACANGPGAVEWYEGLQSLMTHAKMKGATPVKLHRELAIVLEEELTRKGTPDINVEGQCSKGQSSRWSTNNIMLRILVPSHKVGQLIGTGGAVIRDINTTYNCTLRVVHRFEDEPTAIILGKDEPDLKVPGAVDALLRVHRISTSQGQLRTAAARRIVTRMLARMHHVTNFSGIAEECHTDILIKEDVRMSALPEDRVIEVSGEIHGVRKTVFVLSQYLCQFLLDDSIVSLFFVEPKRHFKSISPLVKSWYQRLPFEYRSVADSAIDIINTDTGVVGVVQYDTQGLVVVEIIGKRIELQRAIEFFKKTVVDLAGLPIN